MFTLMGPGLAFLEKADALEARKNNAGRSAQARREGRNSHTPGHSQGGCDDSC
jgi:hypothetical protein